MKHSVYEFEVRVNNRPVKEYPHDGQVFIEGREGSEYSLYFRNSGYGRVLIVPSVDGLSIMDGKPASDKSSGYVANAFDSIHIEGWRIDESKVAKFVFGSKDKSYAKKREKAGLESSDAQGFIGLMVFDEKPTYQQSYGLTNTVFQDYNWPHGFVTCSTFTADPGAMIFGAANASIPMNSSIGTGFGDSTNFATEKVSFVKNSETPKWIGVIQYDTLKNLERRGIPIHEITNVNRAFPGYTPPSGGCWVPGE